MVWFPPFATSLLYRVSLPVLTLGGTSSEGAFSLGEGLGWGWGCGSVRAGVDDDDVDEGDEDGG